MNFKCRLFPVLTVVALLVAGAIAQVQTSELHVIVKDAKGAVVPGATVTAADADKGISKICPNEWRWHRSLAIAASR